MIFEFRPSFRRLYKALKKKAPQRAEQVRAAVGEAAASLEQRKPVPAGLGLSKLRGNYWEIRSTLSDRILFYWRKETVQWILVGNHDDVHRFLSRG